MAKHPIIQPEMTVTAVAEQWPATLPVFARHGIDLCCGGARSLAFVAEAHRLDLGLLLGALEQARGGPQAAASER